MKYYLIAGEPSGDLHGSNLIKGLLKADPEARLRFWGGDLMAAAGGEANLAKHYRETSFFGIVQVLKNLRTIKRQMRECRADVAAFAPDVLILVDYPGFNIKMARWAKEHGIRTFYYIAPKVWAWREWRVKAIRRYAMICWAPGRWIFTATSSPVTRRARCTCASEAEPSGLGSTASKISPSFWPYSASRQSTITL